MTFQDNLVALAQRFAPILILHPDEIYLLPPSTGIYSAWNTIQARTSTSLVHGASRTRMARRGCWVWPTTICISPATTA